MVDVKQIVTIRHWLPIVTFCPVNKLPDLVYISVTFEGDEINELYAVRREVRRLIGGKRLYMEDIAELVLMEFPNASEVRVALAFNRHIVIRRRL